MTRRWEVTTLMDVPDPAARSPKAEQTRRAIVDAAMRLFRGSGYDRTTMRAIATEAGVSVGNAYYYFGSKEHLVQAFYDQLQTEHAEAAGLVLAQEKTFAARLEGVLAAWLDVAAPHHEFAGQFFKNAAEPTSPLSPFSTESAPAREASIALFATPAGRLGRQGRAGAAPRAARAALAAADGDGAVLGLRPEPGPGAHPHDGAPDRPDRRPAGEAVPDARRTRHRRRRRRPDGRAEVMTGRVVAAAYVATVAVIATIGFTTGSTAAILLAGVLALPASCPRSSAATSPTVCWPWSRARARTAQRVRDVLARRRVPGTSTGALATWFVVTTDVVGILLLTAARRAERRARPAAQAHPQRKRFSFSPDSVGSLTAIPSATARSRQPSPSREIRAITTPVSGTPRVSVIRASSTPCSSTTRQ